MPPPLGVVIIQIRGPGILGPHLQIRGPGITEPDIAGYVDDQLGRGGPLGVLMAGSWADVSGLTARWPDLGEPGWLVGRSITRLAFDKAIEEAIEAGVELRMLIAEDVGDITTLTGNWAIN